MDVKILNLIREKGLLLEREIYNLLEIIKDKDKAISFLEQIERISGKKIITKNTLNNNEEYVKSFIGNLPVGDKEYVEKTFINLGIRLETSRFVFAQPSNFCSQVNKSNLDIRGEIKRFPKPSLFPQQADGVLRSASGQKRQESKILELPKNSTPEFLVSLIAKPDDTAELRDIKPNLAINETGKEEKKNMDNFGGYQIHSLKFSNETILNNHYTSRGIANIEIPSNSVTLQSGISNRHSRTKDDTINGNVYNQDFKINYFNTNNEKKLEVKDFTGYFKARYQQLQRILIQRAELQNDLISINKISSERTNLSIIGIVKDKRITNNGNIILKLEDLTGEIRALVKFDKVEVFEKADEILLDDVIGIKASGNREMLFINDIYYPESMIYEKVRFNEEKSVAFLSDVHCGSDRHLGREFENFLRWINSDDESARKIRYLFFIGDNVDGVGIFPNQEDVLKLKSMKEQYKLLAHYLRQIPKYITIFMCPGQHDAVRVAEPQPLISKRYASELYEIENLILVTNPTMVKLLEGDKEFKVLMYHGASIHTFINEIKNLRLMKAHKTPAKAVEQMLKRRHLAPTHGDIVYIPSIEQDPLVISEVPDVLCTGEVHRLDISNYRGVLIITGSCWQAQTPFEEKVGNIPDPCKVPVFNLKTRELKVFDFSGRDGE